MQAIPAEKVIPGTGFTVDGFRHCSNDVQAYFLSHAHSDHYTGLTENWAQGLIHCSPVTAKLVVHLLGIKPEFLKPLAMDCVHHIQGVNVTLVDANHCPGAVQFLFELANGEKYIHCGDMRFGPHLLQNSHLKYFQDANAVFLDTTYCNPKYTFPPQEEAVQYVASTVDRLLNEQRQQGLKRVYVISTYVIGKERLLVAVHNQTGCKIGVTQQKLDTIKCLDLPGVDIDEVFTTDMASTPVHVAKWGFLGESWPFFRPNFVNMEQYRTDMNVDEVVGFVPTGWMYEMKRKAFPIREKGPCFIHLVPYSEHSSYTELRDYVRFLRPHKVTPTVGVHADDASGKKSANMQRHFRHLVNETASKQRFLRSLHRTNSAREASGTLPSSLKQQCFNSGSEQPAVKQELWENGRTGHNSQQQSHVTGHQVMVVKPELFVKDEPGFDQPGFAATEQTSADEPMDAHASAAAAAAAGLPESLGQELGDAACLKADPDSLMEDALHPFRPHPAPLASIHAQPTHAVKQNADQPDAHHSSANLKSPVVQDFIDIVGADVDVENARRFVARASGHLDAAINSFYDSKAVEAATTFNSTPQGGGPQQASSSETSAKSVTHSTTQSLADDVVASMLKKPASKQQAGKQLSKGRKRSGSAQATATIDSASKKQKSSAAAQRSIAAFFGGAQSGARQDVAAIKEEEGGKQRAPSSTEQASRKRRALATPPQPGIKLEDVVDMHEEKAAGYLLTEATEAINLVDDATDTDTKLPDGPKAAAAVTGEQAAPLASDCAQKLPAKNGEVKIEQQQGESSNEQPVHPFFGQGKLKPPKHAPAPPKTTDPIVGCSAAFNGHVHGSDIQPEGKRDVPEGRTDQSKGNSKPVNPFAKVRAEPEREVPADAVLLPTSEYDPVKMAVWEAGQATPYRHISRAFQAMESTTKRLRIGDAIANMFRSILALSPDNMLQAAYLTIGKLAPDYENVELSVGGSTVAAAVVEATGTSRAKLREMYNELGDMGDVAQACRHTQTMLHRPAPLTVPGVYKTLRQIALEKGQGSAARRQQAVLGMLRSCREHETKFLVRTLVSNLRVGANWRSVIGAMARAVVMHREGPKVPKARLDAAATAASEAYHVCPNLAILVPALVEGGIDELDKRCALTPGVPLKPMLAKISEGIPDAIKQLKGAPFLAEYKYDGTRAQIHLLPDNSVKVFSRNCEDKTLSMPDVVAAIQAAAKGGSTSLVLDAELVAVDRADGNRLKAFQELSTRARGEITAHQVTMHVCVFVFDVLYVDGDSLVHLPLRQRRARLAAALPNLEPGHVQFATSMEFKPAAVSAAVAAAAVAAAVEGDSLAAASNGASTAVAQDAMDADKPKNGATSETTIASGSNSADTSIPSGIQASSDGTRRSSKRQRQARGGGDVDATADAAIAGAAAAAAAAAQTHSPQAADLPSALEAIEEEAVVSDLAVQSIEDRIQEFLLESFAGGTEGLMLKALDVAAGYQPSKRSDSWIKLKRDYCEGLRDSLDLVVIGAWYGQGRKVKWFSPFLLAAWDPDTEEYQSVCRCMSGYTDAFYAEKTAQFKATAIPAKKPYYRTDESPDVWFEPTEVWEIRGADLTVSPVHKAAVGHIHPDRGISLRFPRFITIRSDRQPEDASTPEVIVDLYNKQSRRMTSAAVMLASKNKIKSAADAERGDASDQDDEVDVNEDPMGS